MSYHDPHVPRFSVGPSPFHRRRETFQSVPLDDEALDLADLVLVVTAHKGVDYTHVAARARRLVDTTSATRHIAGRHIARLGCPTDRD